MKTQSSWNIGVRALLVSALAAGSSAPAMADAVPNMFWTHVASAGTVDKADLAAALFDYDTLTNVGPGAGTVRVRYNVVAVDGLAGGPFDAALVVRYRDLGSLSQVVAQLWQVSIDTGERTVLAELDSNALEQRPGFQTRQVEACQITFDFTRNTYYVGVRLIRSTAPGSLPGTPALAALQIKPTACLY
jgi:hypothetical protein